MKWWQRLSFKLTCFILLLAVVPLAGFGITTINDVRRVRLHSVEEIHKGIATRSSNRIEYSLTYMIEKFQLIIASGKLDTTDISEQESFLKLLIQTIPHVHALTITNITGREMVKVGRDAVYHEKDLKSYRNFPDFRTDNIRTPIIGETHFTRSNLPVLDLFVPLVNSMERQGAAVLVAEVDLERCWGLLKSCGWGRRDMFMLSMPREKCLPTLTTVWCCPVVPDLPTPWFRPLLPVKM